MWRAFIGEITGGNSDLQANLQRLAGYYLTGSTREQSFAFLHGDGAHGKSVFLSTIAHVLGDYAATATLDAFMSAPGTRHLTELAGLRAGRLFLVPEKEQGRSWAEGRNKTITGGEKNPRQFHASGPLRVHTAVQTGHCQQSSPPTLWDAAKRCGGAFIWFRSQSPFPQRVVIRNSSKNSGSSVMASCVG